MQETVIEHSDSDLSDSDDNPYVNPSKIIGRKPSNNHQNFEKVRYSAHSNIFLLCV